MRELAMRAVGGTPLLEQRQDLGELLIEQPVHRQPARALSANCPAARRAIQRCARTSRSSSSWQARRSVQPPSTAESSSSSSLALVTASTRSGTRPLSPNVLFPRPASASRPSP